MNITVHMVLYLDKHLELACGSGHLLKGLHIVSYCEVMEGGLYEITLAKL